MNRSVSSRFLYEATNQHWSRFLHEAIGGFELTVFELTSPIKLFV